ncbi:ABC transporter ATP-binding protein [Kineosporia rhizophila]|uniref:ABC transporter ATP-binding protein n=1 Tax=Kineosporia rhizophila TaxID=84633 RepID=UPI000AB3A175|nr:ABC transporter ATP-binding protein [Kineosporia rhizophila]MCE0539332.1 ABC transporter ATP-binding protein [Kineosporia rhizophila]
MNEPMMVQARGLRKTFMVRRQPIEAVRNVSLDVPAGGLLALLGPNGAGKSTTMRMLTTLLPPTAGSVHVGGIDAVAEPARARRQIGYVGQKSAAGENYRVRDELTTQGRCFGLPVNVARERADEALEMLGIAALANRMPGTLSGGQRRRVDIAFGLVHRPRVLFLDEPTTGLDPHSRAGVWEQIDRLRAEHDMTVVLTTHYLDEVERAAGQIVIVDEGEVVAEGTPAELRGRVSGSSSLDDVFIALTGRRLHETGEAYSRA